jgi:hypothetical protein
MAAPAYALGKRTGTTDSNDGMKYDILMIPGFFYG